MILSARLCNIVQIFLIKHNLMYVKYWRVIFTASAERLNQVAAVYTYNYIRFCKWITVHKD